MEYSKKEILALLQKKTKALTSWYTDNPIEKMESGPEGAWTAGQHLLHMIKSTKPLAKGAGYPRILLRFKFGKVDGPSSSYEELVKKYQSAIESGGKATGPYVPRTVRKEEREELLSRFRSEMSVLVNNLHKWSEKNLDNTAVPHPLIGNLTLREMLYFTMYHMDHHLKILQERY